MSGQNPNNYFLIIPIRKGLYENWKDFSLGIS